MSKEISFQLEWPKEDKEEDTHHSIDKIRKSEQGREHPSFY
jgi:hypothetical protein